MTGTGAPTYPHDLFTDEALIAPFERYRTLRKLGTVVWLDAHQMYAIPRYAALKAALGDAATFLSGKGVALNDTFNAVAAGRNLIITDGPLHAHLRDVLGRNITPRAIRHMEDSVERLARELVDELLDRGDFDAVTDLAHALPLRVVPDLVGWPEERREHLVEWASATFNVLGPLNDRAKQSIPTAQAMLEYAAEAAATGDLLPGSVGAGVIETARRGDLEQERVAPLLVGYLAPSLDTTISALGSMVWLLATHPEQWAALKQDPELAANAFEEVVRLESPIRVFSRVTSRAVEVGGVEIPEGARVMLLYASANRDERQFDQPDSFDVRRPDAREHVGFGYGVHGCAGQGMARMEGRALLRALLERVDRIELIGTPQRSLNNLIHAFASLPMRVTGAAR